MSVDIEEMAAHLDGRRQDDVKEQYDARATNATTAFLLCFFLGFIGAHRFYLNQWRSGFAHLVLFALGAAGVVGGFLTGAPFNAVLLVIGGLLVLASLIWEVIDLGRIDDEIHRRNLLLAEGLIAGALLSDTSVMDQAVHKLDEVVHTAAAQSQAAGDHPAAATAGAISLADLAQAREMAEQSGRAAISYDAVTTFDVSAAPGEHAGDHPAFAPETTTERRVNTQPLPSAQDAMTPIETETHTHTVDGYHVTDAQETDRVSGPSAAEALGLGAAALGAAGLGFGLAEAAHTDQQPAPFAEAMEQETGPLHTPGFAQESPVYTQLEQSHPAEPFTPTAPPAPSSGVDVTDAGAPAAMEPTADVAYASAYPSFVALPDQMAPPIAPASPEAVTQPDVPLYVMPDEPVQTYTGFEPAAESYTPPAPEIATQQAELYTPTTPSWDAPAEAAQPAHGPSALEDMAGLGALAGAGALAADAWAHHEAPAPEPESEPLAAEPMIAEPVAPPAPKMRRIRVKHRIVVEGQVVREEIVEREIPADADMAAAARQIQEELERGQSASPDEIARLANLSGDEEVEVRRRVEGLGQ